MAGSVGEWMGQMDGTAKIERLTDSWVCCSVARLMNGSRRKLGDESRKRWMTGSWDRWMDKRMGGWMIGWMSRQAGYQLTADRFNARVSIQISGLTDCLVSQYINYCILEWMNSSDDGSINRSFMKLSGII